MERILETNRLRLRKFKDDDLDYLFDLLKNDNVCKGLPKGSGYTYEECKKWLNAFINRYDEEIHNQVYAAVLKSTDELIGYVGLQHIKEVDEIEVMYAFNENHWGFGYATEAGEKMMELANNKKLKRIVGFTSQDNYSSQNVLRKLGLTYIKDMDIFGMNCKYFIREL